MVIYWLSMKLRVLLWQRIGWIFIRSHWRCILTFQWWSLDSSVFIGSCWRWVLIFQWGRLGFLNKRLFIKLVGFIIFVKLTCIFVTLVHKTSHTGQSSESWIDFLGLDNIWRDTTIWKSGIWGCKQIINYNIEKITFKVSQSKIKQCLLLIKKVLIYLR